MEFKVNIKSDKNLYYETDGACAFDLKAGLDIEIEPMRVGMIETGVVIDVPEGYMLMLVPRSSTYKKMGSLLLVNSVGIIDNDYCGNNDTIKFQYLNTGMEKAVIKRGDRIGQGVFVKIEKAQFNYVDKMRKVNRGGFGTTGIK